ncbi:MAG TPA: DUF1810 domain-containing protein [Puia sp.]|jgi:uncharacterized protein (DUF1810 family)|nr:DUF1810 domain-containing protein [Puia sp.]
MHGEINLSRFIDAQKKDYSIAVEEIKHGRKRSHWIWYIFPQIIGLGYSETSKYYAIQNMQEANEYLKHPVLGNRLINICQALLDQAGNDANKIFGSPDNLKLKSSMTLFASLKETNPVFQKVLDKFFNGSRDSKTVEIIHINP